MKNKTLMKKISDSLLELCFSNKLIYINKLTLVINIKYKISKNELIFFLIEEVGMLIGIDTVIIIKKVEITNEDFYFEFVEGIDFNNNYQLFNRC